MAPFGALCGAVAAALKLFESLLGPLGKRSELPWTPSDAGGRVVGSHQVLQQKQANLLKHSSKNEKVDLNTRAPAPFFLSLKTKGVLMILRVREPRQGNVPSPALENARTP